MDENTHNIVIVEKGKKINWLAAALVVVIIMIIFGWCRGYRNGLATTAAIDDLKKLKDSVEQVTKRQDAQLEKYKADSALATEVANDQKRFVEHLEDTLAKSETYTKYLADRIKAAYRERDKSLGKVDTIDIINNCDDLAEAYLSEVDKRNVLQVATDSLDRQRLKQIAASDKLANHFRGRYDTAMMAYNTCVMLANSMRVRANLKAGVTGLYSPFLAGAGISAAYEDRKGKLFQVSAIVTDKGLLYQGSVLLKLSFKRK